MPILQTTQPRLSKWSERIPTTRRFSSTFFPSHHSDTQHTIHRHPLTEMSHPDPCEAPDAFGDYLKSSELHFAQTVFDHYRNRPIETNGRFDEGMAQGWCERMDVLLVSIRHLLTLLTNHLPFVGQAQSPRRFATGSPGCLPHAPQFLYEHGSHHRRSTGSAEGV
jgi:hypothetical protein